MRALVSKKAGAYFKTYSVNIKFYPGATTEDITDYLRLAMRKTPRAIIIHTGSQ